MPCVINLSMGFNGGGHDGNTVMKWIIDALSRKSGRAGDRRRQQNSPDKAIYVRDAETRPARRDRLAEWPLLPIEAG